MNRCDLTPSLGNRSCGSRWRSLVGDRTRTLDGSDGFAVAGGSLCGRSSAGRHAYLISDIRCRLRAPLPLAVRVYPCLAVFCSAVRFGLRDGFT